MSNRGIKIARIEIDHSNQGYFGKISFDFKSARGFTSIKASVETMKCKCFDSCLTELKSLMYDYVEYNRHPNWRQIRREKGWV